MVGVNRFEVVIYTESEAATIELGQRLGRLLHAGDVVSLDGPLGVGKTRIAAGIATQLGADRDAITSPTFTLIHEYATRPAMAHLDAYRLADSDEFLALGVSELWEDGIVIVEWGRKVADALPPDTLFLRGTAESEATRQWSFAGASAEWAERLQALASA